MRLSHRSLCHHFSHDLDACGADHVHDTSLRLRTTTLVATTPHLRCNSIAFFSSLLHVGNAGTLCSNAATNNGTSTFSDVSCTLPAGTHFRHRIAKWHLDRFGEALSHGMSQLAVGVGSPAKNSTALGDSDSVTATTRKIDDLFTVQKALDLVRPLLAHSAFSMKAPTELTKIVVAPCVELTLLRQRAHVLVTGRNAHDLQSLEAHLTLGFVTVTPSLCEHPWEVGSLKSAPAPHFTTLGDADGVVTSGSYLRNVCLIGKLCVRWQRSVFLVTRTQLPKVVLSPCKNATSLRERDGVLFPDADLADSLALECQDR
mmetsp:Transcript_106566/g.254438  ORF Transcript_106566/g.254438 Transcript_106566/m.254438 type:complete len:315 (-) Transcript_106566:594-1538(-)